MTSIQKLHPNVAEGFERLAQQAKGKVSIHAIEEEYDQRYVKINQTTIPQ